MFRTGSLRSEASNLDMRTRDVASNCKELLILGPWRERRKTWNKIKTKQKLSVKKKKIDKKKKKREKISRDSNLKE